MTRGVSCSQSNNSMWCHSIGEAGSPFLPLKPKQGKKSSTQDNLLGSLPSLYVHSFLSGQKKNLSSHSLSSFFLVSVISAMRQKFEYIETSPVGRRHEKEQRIMDMAEEAHDL